NWYRYVSNHYYFTKCNCRNMGVWCITRTVTTLIIFMDVSIKSVFIIIFIITFLSTLHPSCNISSDKEIVTDTIPEVLWYGWNKYQIKPEDSLVRLGYNLIDSTSYFFGPKGKI